MTIIPATDPVIVALWLGPKRRLLGLINRWRTHLGRGCGSTAAINAGRQNRISCARIGYAFKGTGLFPHHTVAPQHARSAALLG